MNNLNYYAEQVVWQEVPEHTSLAFTICGCPIGCKGCHSAESWPENSGYPLSAEMLHDKLLKYSGLISCVLFLGGEWHPALLKELLLLCKKHRLHTCLYTGLELREIPTNLIDALDFVKTGPWKKEFGPLGSPSGNQRFYDLKNRRDLTWKFQSPQHHDSQFHRMTSDSDMTLFRDMPEKPAPSHDNTVENENISFVYIDTSKVTTKLTINSK